MAMNGEAGSSLIEALIAILLVGIAAMGLTSGFSVMLDTNTRCEERTAAVAAAEQELEGLRMANVETLPETGKSAAKRVRMDERDYDVVIWYCKTKAYCTDNSRHLEIEVTHDGRTVYTVETVFTQLQ